MGCGDNLVVEEDKIHRLIDWPLEHLAISLSAKSCGGILYMDMPGPCQIVVDSPHLSVLPQGPTSSAL